MGNAGKRIIGIVSGDDSGQNVLRSLAGIGKIEKNGIWERIYPQVSHVSPKRMKFVPDDVVCYSNLSVKQFIRAMALSCGKGQETATEAVRLLQCFGIPQEEHLLNLTFEDGHLVSMVQAMMSKPELLLLENPHDMIGEKKYLILLGEWIKLFRGGTRYIIAERTYEDIHFPCQQYLFTQAGEIVAEYSVQQLPKPAKVITMAEGDLSQMDSSKVKVLFQKGGSSCFLYEETDMKELSLRLGKTGCKDYLVEDIRLDERVFGNYERWTA